MFKNHDHKKKIVFALIVFFFFGYFVYHILTGKRGVVNLFLLTSEKKHLDSDIVKLSNEKTDLERKVSMMKSSNINKDLLDEQVKKKLGYVEKGSKIYSYNKD